MPTFLVWFLLAGVSQGFSVEKPWSDLSVDPSHATTSFDSPPIGAASFSHTISASVSASVSSLYELLRSLPSGGELYARVPSRAELAIHLDPSASPLKAPATLSELGDILADGRRRRALFGYLSRQRRLEQLGSARGSERGLPFFPRMETYDDPSVSISSPAPSDGVSNGGLFSGGLVNDGGVLNDGLFNDGGVLNRLREGLDVDWDFWDGYADAVSAAASANLDGESLIEAICHTLNTTFEPFVTLPFRHTPIVTPRCSHTHLSLPHLSHLSDTHSSHTQVITPHLSHTQFIIPHCVRPICHSLM